MRRAGSLHRSLLRYGEAKALTVRHHAKYLADGVKPGSNVNIKIEFEVTENSAFGGLSNTGLSKS